MAEAVYQPVPGRHLRLDVLLKAQAAVLGKVLPALQAAIDEVAAYLIDEDDDAETAAYMRELATETVIDELVSVLTRDPRPVSHTYALVSPDGISTDTLIACHSEVSPASAQRWYASTLGIDAAAHLNLLYTLPGKLTEA